MLTHLGSHNSIRKGKFFEALNVCFETEVCAVGEALRPLADHSGFLDPHELRYLRASVQ